MSKIRKVVLPLVLLLAGASLAACEPVTNAQVTHEGSVYHITWDAPECDDSTDACDYWSGDWVLATPFFPDGSLNFQGSIPACQVPRGEARSCDFDLRTSPAGNYAFSIFSAYSESAWQTDHDTQDSPPWYPSSDGMQAAILNCFDVQGETVVLKTVPCAAYSWLVLGTATVTADGNVIDTTNPFTAPGAPSQVSVEAADAQVLVSWKAPESDGGSAITGYTATATPGGASCTTEGETSCTITGLTNDTIYTVEVTATNAAGTSIPSGPPIAVTPLMALPADDFTVVAAAPRADVIFDTGYASDSSHVANGTAWYFNPDMSWGFARPGAVLAKNSCDGGDLGWADSHWHNDGGLRLCWHTSGGIFNGGWRAGDYKWLNDDFGTYRAVYVSNDPSYYPSGPQINISQKTLADGGWTRCFTSHYGDYAPLVQTVLDNCQGEYLLLAGMAGYNNWVSKVAPRAPTNVYATGGDGTATVTWDASDDGGAPITGYTATDGAGHSCTADGESQSCTITGLPNLQWLSFTVSATNEIGDSPASDMSNRVLLHTSDFQVWVERRNLCLENCYTDVYVFGATGGISNVRVKIGKQIVNVAPDGEGTARVGFYTYGAATKWKAEARAVRVSGGVKSPLYASDYIYGPRLKMPGVFRNGATIRVRAEKVASGSSLRVVVAGQEVCSGESDGAVFSCIFDWDSTQTGEHRADLYEGNTYLDSKVFVIRAPKNGNPA